VKCFQTLVNNELYFYKYIETILSPTTIPSLPVLNLTPAYIHMTEFHGNVASDNRADTPPSRQQSGPPSDASSLERELHRCLQLGEGEEDPLENGDTFKESGGYKRFTLDGEVV